MKPTFSATQHGKYLMNRFLPLLAAMLLAWACSKSPPNRSDDTVRKLPRATETTPMADDSKYHAGDYLVYNGKGLVQIQKLETNDGEEMLVLKVFDGSEMIIGVPASNAGEAVRQPMDKAAAKTAWEELKKPGTPDARHWEDRYFDYARTMVKGTTRAQVAHLRTMYSSPYKPSFGERRLIDSYESILFSELAHVLGREVDDLRAEMKSAAPVFSEDAKDRRPEPERPAPVPKGPKIGGYDLLGSFQVEGGLVVADPGRHKSTDDDEPGLNFRVAAIPGEWYGYVAEDEEMGRTGILVAVHSSKLGMMPRRSLSKLQKKATVSAKVRVDGGQMAILDQAVREDERYEDEMFFRTRTGTVLGRGCTSESGFGDGTYPVSVVMESGKAVYLHVDFR